MHIYYMKKLFHIRINIILITKSNHFVYIFRSRVMAYHHLDLMRIFYAYIYSRFG